MPIFGLGKRKEEVKEIKEAISGAPPAPYPMSSQMREPSYEEQASYPMPRSAYPLRQRMPEQPQMGPQQKFAPLFIKIDRYKEILEAVADLRGTIANITSIIRAKESIQKLSEDADALLLRQLNACDECVSALDSAFVKPPALEPMIVAQPEMIEGDLQMLSNKLEQLSGQLREMG